MNTSFSEEEKEEAALYVWLKFEFKPYFIRASLKYVNWNP